MGTNGSDSVNDLDGPHAPSFVGVAICIGTDLQGEPVTLIDRLCINRPGVEKINDDYAICQQEMKAFRAEAAYLQDQLVMESDKSTAAGVGFLIVMIVLGISAVLRLGRK